MSYSKKDLLEAKEKIGQSRLKSLRKKTKSESKKAIKNENFSKKSIIHKYNFIVNELVYIKHSGKIGLIIDSYDTYSSRKVQKDCYLVFVENIASTFEGCRLKKL
jgi:hypothetical protein